MLDNLTSYLNSSSNRSLCYSSKQAKSNELPNQFLIADILQKSEWNAKTHVMYRSTPNLADISENLYFDKIKNRLFKNKSTECLSNSVDHLGNFLFNAYQKCRIIEGYSNEEDASRESQYNESKKLEDIYKFLNSENTHVITIKKDSRGLGFSISGGKDSSKSDLFSQLIRVSKLYPLQPAIASGSIFVGDIILEVNGTSMIGLTNTEALEFLRSSDSDVTFKVFRPTKYSFPSLSLCKEFWPIALSASFSRGINGRIPVSESANLEEFEIVLFKEDGALGFTICKHEEKNCDLKGFYVHELIREPAISSFIHPGDFIVKVNGICISSFTHEEALSLLRNSPFAVTLTLIRPNPPVSPLSLEDETPLNKPLRWEAVELLKDRIKQKYTATCVRKHVRKRNVSSTEIVCQNEENRKHEDSDSDAVSETQKEEDIDIFASSEDIDNRIISDSLESTEDFDSDALSESQKEEDIDVFVSCKDNDNRIIFHSLEFTEDINSDAVSKTQKDEDFDQVIASRNYEYDRWINLCNENETLKSFNSRLLTRKDSDNCNSDVSGDNQSAKDVQLISARESLVEVKIFEVVLRKGWHTRLGFSLHDPPDEGINGVGAPSYLCVEVKAVYPNTLASRDGRIQAKDRLIEVDSKSLCGIPAAQVIELLRKKTGRIRMVFCRLKSEVKY